jgi:hypothetical protein
MILSTIHTYPKGFTKAGRSLLKTWEFELGWNRFKVNLTEYEPLPHAGYCTWYPFSFYWWPPQNQWFRWRLLGIHIRLHIKRFS